MIICQFVSIHCKEIHMVYQKTENITATTTTTKYKTFSIAIVFHSQRQNINYLQHDYVKWQKWV